MGDFAKGFADREDYWREQKRTDKDEQRRDQASLATAATTLNNYIRQNPQATEADIDAFARNLHPSGAAGILGAGGLQRAYQANQQAINRQEEDRAYTLQQREYTEKTNLLTFNKNKRDLFENALTEELAAQPYGQTPRQEMDIRSAGQRAGQKLSGMYPEIDFTDIISEYSYLTRAQKVAQNRAKKQQEAAEIVRGQIVANPQAYSGEGNEALAKLREDTRVKFGFEENVQLVPDQEVAALVIDGVRKKAVADAEQNASALSDVYNQLGERALAAKNPEALMRDAEQILSMNYDEQMVAHLMKSFDPERAIQKAEGDLMAARSSDITSMAKESDDVQALISNLGWGHLNISERVKDRLSGFVNQYAPHRSKANREFLQASVVQEMPDYTRILRDVYSGNGKVAEEYLASLNKETARKYTMDDLKTSIRFLVTNPQDANSIPSRLKSEITDLSQQKSGDVLLKREALSNILIEVAKDRFDLNSDGTTNDGRLRVINILLNNATIQTHDQLHTAIAYLEKQTSLMDSEGVNLLAAADSAAIALKNNSPIFRSITEKQSIQWDYLLSADELLANPERYLAQFASAEVLSEVDRKISDFGEESPIEIKRVNHGAAWDAINEAQKAITEETKLLAEYGAALRESDYKEYQKLIDQLQQDLNTRKAQIPKFHELESTAPASQNNTTSNEVPTDNSETSSATSSSRPSRAPTQGQQAELKRQRDIKEIEEEIARLQRPVPTRGGAEGLAEKELQRRQSLIQELEQRLSQLKGS